MGSSLKQITFYTYICKHYYCSGFSNSFNFKIPPILTDYEKNENMTKLMKWTHDIDNKCLKNKKPNTTYNKYFSLRTAKMVLTTDHQHVIKESCG